MPSMSSHAFFAVALLSCGSQTDSTQDSGHAELAWYTTCGDPACSSYSGPFDGVALCADEQEGVSCAERDATCDPVSDCNALLICTDEDPKAQEGGCPISRRQHKQDVHYLDPTEVAALARDVNGVRLATWRYTWAGDTDATQLGFVIEDQPDVPAIRPDQQQVDLYAWTSMAVAGLQAQAAEMSALEARLAALEARCEQP